MAKSTEIKLVIRQLKEPKRLDRTLRDLFPLWGRRRVSILINGHNVRVNGRSVWLCSWKVKNGDVLEIYNPPRQISRTPTVFDDNWVISDEADLLVINKPAGLLVHASRSAKIPDLLSLAQKQFGSLVLIHRLDRDTSGIVLLTRSRMMNRYLDKSFKANMIRKEYIAIVSSKHDLPSEGTINIPIRKHRKRHDLMEVAQAGGRLAVTRYQVLGSVKDKKLLALWPETGRTHQLRIHLSHLKAPILGDRLYNQRVRLGFERLLLHAYQISLPESNGFPARAYTAPIQEDFIQDLPLSLIKLIKRHCVIG